MPRVRTVRSAITIFFASEKAGMQGEVTVRVEGLIEAAMAWASCCRHRPRWRSGPGGCQPWDLGNRVPWGIGMGSRNESAVPSPRASPPWEEGGSPRLLRRQHRYGCAEPKADLHQAPSVASSTLTGEHPGCALFSIPGSVRCQLEQPTPPESVPG